MNGWNVCIYRLLLLLMVNYTRYMPDLVISNVKKLRLIHFLGGGREHIINISSKQ